jgi:dihydroxy-acid dehydratase
MGRYKAGRITEEEFYEIERCACPGPGACGFMGTANTMACIVESLGLALPGCATLPALDPARRATPVAAGSSSWCGRTCVRGPC